MLKLKKIHRIVKIDQYFWMKSFMKFRIEEELDGEAVGKCSGSGSLNLKNYLSTLAVPNPVESRTALCSKS